MKYCEKCKVYVPSDREHCPLCQSILVEEDASRSYQGYDDEIFPYLPTIYHRHNLLIRLSLFLSIAVCVICLTLNLLVWPQRWWSLFVLAGVGAGWATVAQAIRKRSSFCKHVLYQVVTVGIVVVLFDLMTGFGHWSFMSSLRCAPLPWWSSPSSRRWDTAASPTTSSTWWCRRSLG